MWGLCASLARAAADSPRGQNTHSTKHKDWSPQPPSWRGHVASGGAGLQEKATAVMGSGGVVLAPNRSHNPGGKTKWRHKPWAGRPPCKGDLDFQCPRHGH